MTTKQPSESLLFNAARRIENPDERARYLADACGKDTGLRERVEKLLVALDAESQFLEQPAEGLQPTVVLADHHPSVLRQLSNTMDEVPRISLVEPPSADADPVLKPASPEIPKSQPDSRYRLDGEIARGGMGAVLKGRDTDLGRDLAIKVLLDAHRNNPQVIQRFIEEAQIGGQLQHPGIAPVYELGRFADDRPFFSMKLVKGETLSKLLSQRKDPSHDRARFLGIFEQVCQTVAYAHSRNVIHRDLKPANIMVGAFGEVQVMDWGLAKVLASGGVADERKARDSQQTMSIVQTMRSMGSDAPASFGSVGSAGSETQMGSVMGTPAYMPPEQALGEIDQLDQRSDVFGLGAILAEILTGKPPYVGDDGTQVFRMASRGKLDDCFARLDTCGADAELIQLTKACLELEPADRPKDAGIVAERVSHYQESVETKLRQTEIQRAAEAARADAEALRAVAERQRAEAEAARAREERQRRRTSLALAASILILVGLAAGGWAWITSERNQRISRVTREASTAFNDASLLAEQAKNAATESSAALFSQARERLQRALALTEDGLLAQDLVSEIHELETDLNNMNEDSNLLAALDAAWLAEMDFDTDAQEFSNVRAMALFRSALTGYGLLIAETDLEFAAKKINERPLKVKNAISSALFRLAARANDSEETNWLLNLVVLTEDEDSFNISFLEATYGPEEGRLARLENLASRIAEIQISPYQCLSLCEQFEGEQRIDLLRKAIQRFPNDFFLSLSLAFYLTANQPPLHDEAIRYLSTAIALRPNHADAYAGLASSLHETKRYAESIACWNRAIELGIKTDEIYSFLASTYAESCDFQNAINTYEKAVVMNANERNLNNLGAIYCDKLLEYDKAIEYFRKAIELEPQSITAFSNLGIALRAKNDFSGLIANCKEAIGRGIETSDIYRSLGIAYMELGELDAARISFQKAIDFDPTDADSLNAFGAFLCDYVNEHLTAAECFRKVVELNPQDDVGLFNLGNALTIGGNTVDGIAAYEECFRLDNSDSRRYGSAATLVGNTYLDGRFPYAPHAVEWALRAIALEPENAEYFSTLGKVLYRSEQTLDAFAFEKSINLGADTPVNWLCLALSLAKRNQTDSARKWYNKFLLWKSGNEADFADDLELRILLEQVIERLDAKSGDAPSSDESDSDPSKKNLPAESVNSDSTDK